MIPYCSIFRFKLRAVGKDPTGYYCVNWKDAQTITVVAQTLAEAGEKAKEVLGEHRDGFEWLIEVDNIDEIFTHIKEESP